MHLATTVFPQFLSAGTTIFIACQDAGTIWGQGQCHYTVKCMQSRVLACEHSATATTCAPQRVIVTDLMILRCMHTVFYLQYRAVLFARKERGCLGRDVWCGVSCHPSKLMQCTRPSSVPSFSTEIPQTLKELISLLWQQISKLSSSIGGRKACQELYVCQLLVHVVRDIFEGGFNFA